MIYNKKTSTEVEVNVQKKSMKKERGQGIPTHSTTNYSGYCSKDGYKK
jgi:hypothetical protein